MGRSRTASRVSDSLGRSLSTGLAICSYHACSAAFLAGARWVSAQGKPSSECQVKAAFLFHFAQFVDWLSQALKDAGTPLAYCTAGGHPFRGALDASLNGKVIDGRSVRVPHFPGDARDSGPSGFV
jgi:uncharacterized protein DUF4154